MSDFTLDSNGDIALFGSPSGKDFALLHGANAVAQRIQIALRFFKGEWFRRIDYGVPYYDEDSILGAKPNLSVINSVIKSTISSVPGVVEITKFASDFDGVTRKLTIRFSCIADDGPITSELDINL
jgi:hypothetical protein